MNKETIDLLEYIPTHIITSSGKEYQPTVYHDNLSIAISYEPKTQVSFWKRSREFAYTIPRYITKNERAFEVLGLLQAEMGKTQNGTLSFSNYEPKIINAIIRWFDDEELLPKEKWMWSVKVNINEPLDTIFKKEIETKTIGYWLTKTKITAEQGFPKKVTYVKQSKHKEPQNKGTAVLEYRNNLFSQIIKNLVKKVTYEQIVNEQPNYIRSYMQGIIAGEGCVNNDQKSKHFAVHISATKPEEREIYKKCLENIGIELKVYNNYKEMLISRLMNLIQLLKLRLLTLSPSKYAKFLSMMRKYPYIKEKTGYFIGKRQHIWNKHQPEKIDKIIELYKSGVTKTNDIANRVGVSTIKVNRVLRENNIGKRRVPNYTEEFQQKVVAWIKENQMHTNEYLASIFNASKGAIRRIRIKYNCQKPRKLLKATQGQIEEIIHLYRENPAIRFKEVMKKVGVGDTTLQNIRKKYGLTHLGYKYKSGAEGK